MVMDDLVVEVRGDGPVVGYSHGVFLSRASDDALGVFDWSPVVRDGRRLVRYDARGHGQSGGGTEPNAYTWPSLADDLLALADEYAPNGPIDWVGASMGCGTLLWAAVRRPERFRRLVLEIPPTTGQTRVASAANYLAGAESVERQGAGPWRRMLEAYGRPPIFADVDSFVLHADVPEELLPSVMRGAASTDMPSREQLAGLDHPTLILAWDTDPVHPLSSAEMLAATLPNAQLHVSRTADDVRTWGERIAAFLR
jgi:pimeloyl-ACP methyl ester carboxylesterase